MWICASKIFLNEAIGYKVYKFNHDGYLHWKLLIISPLPIQIFSNYNGDQSQGMSPQGKLPRLRRTQSASKLTVRWGSFGKFLHSQNCLQYKFKEREIFFLKNRDYNWISNPWNEPNELIYIVNITSILK